MVRLFTDLAPARLVAGVRNPGGLILFTSTRKERLFKRSSSIVSHAEQFGETKHPGWFPSRQGRISGSCV